MVTVNDSFTDEIVSVFAAAATLTPETLQKINREAPVDRSVAAEYIGAHVVSYCFMPPKRLASKFLNDIYEKIKACIDGKERPLTQEEFLETLEYHGLINVLRQNLKEYARQNEIAPSRLFRRIIESIDNNPAYRNINDVDRIKLARCLTNELL